MEIPVTMRAVNKQHVDRSVFAVIDMHSEESGDDWRFKTPLERLDGLEILRQIWSDYDPDTARLPRFYTVVERAGR